MQKIGDGYLEITGRPNKSELRRAAEESGKFTGGHFGTTFGKKVDDELKGTLRRVATSTMKSEGLRLGGTLGASTGSGLFASLSGGPWFALIGAALIAAIAPPLAAALTSALALGVGGGFLAAGAFVLKGNKTLVKSFESTAKTIKKVLTDAAQPLVGPFSKALGEIGRAAKRLKPLLTAVFAGMAKTVGPLVDGLIKLGEEALRGIKDSLPGIQAAFKGLADSLPGLGRGIGDFFRIAFGNPAVVERTTEMLVELLTSALRPLAYSVRVLATLFGALRNAMRFTEMGWIAAWDELTHSLNEGTGAVDRLRDAWGPLKDAIMDVWHSLENLASAKTDEQIVAAMGDLIQDIKNLWEPFKTFLGAVWNVAWSQVQLFWNDTVVPWWNGTVKPWLQTEIKQFIGNTFKSAVNAAVSWLAGLPGRATGALAGLAGAVGGAIGAAAGAARQKAQELVNGAISIINGLPGKAASAVGKVKGAVTGAFSGAAGWLRDAGKKIIQGLINGITNKIGDLKKKMSEAANVAKSFWPFSPAKEGPLSGSGNPFYAGQSIMELIAEGIKSKQDVLAATTARAADPFTPRLLVPALASTTVGTAPRRTNNIIVTVNVNGAGKGVEDIGDEVAHKILDNLARHALVR